MHWTVLSAVSPQSLSEDLHRAVCRLQDRPANLAFLEKISTVVESVRFEFGLAPLLGAAEEVGFLSNGDYTRSREFGLSPLLVGEVWFFHEDFYTRRCFVRWS